MSELREEDLFWDGGTDPLSDSVRKTTTKPKPSRSSQYIGCPLPWLKQILPLVNSPEQLAVALWLQRRSAICRNKTFTVPNRELREELGLSRFTKYRALLHLERAGIIAIVRDGLHTLRVTLLF